MMEGIHYSERPNRSTKIFHPSAIIPSSYSEHFCIRRKFYINIHTEALSSTKQEHLALKTNANFAS